MERATNSMRRCSTRSRRLIVITMLCSMTLIPTSCASSIANSPHDLSVQAQSSERSKHSTSKDILILIGEVAAIVLIWHMFTVLNTST